MTGRDDRMDDHKFREPAAHDLPSGQDHAEDEEEFDGMFSHLLHYRESPLATTPDPDEGLRARLSALLGQVRPDLLRARPGPVAQARRRLREIVGSLVLDTADPGLSAAGLRSGTQRTRQVTFVSDVADLDLELAPEDGGSRWAVSGQLGLDEIPDNLVIWFVPGHAVTVTAETKPDLIPGAASAPLEPDGTFRVTLPEGNWVALSEIGDAVVLFREIRI